MSEEAKSEEAKTPEEFGKEVYAKALKELRDSVPKIGISITVAILIWLIGNYVFIPISQGLFIQTFAVTQLISLIILIAIAILVIGILSELRDVADAAAGFTAYHFGKLGQATPEELGKYRTAFRGFLYVLVVAALFLLFAQQLNIIHPSLAAIVLLIIVIWAIITLYRSGRALSKIVERYASEWAKRLE
ncbi:MAG: hypothetical protein H3Z50_01910 [archaeon]|nr:hypothetical protein [archaeon]MCP8305537.1 hypothetical protein [archaeon]